MKKLVIIVVWFIVTMIILTWSCSMLTKSSSIANIVGILSIVIYLLLSFKTKCFTLINLNKKSDENN